MERKSCDSHDDAILFNILYCTHDFECFKNSYFLSNCSFHIFKCKYNLKRWYESSGVLFVFSSAKYTNVKWKCFSFHTFGIDAIAKARSNVNFPLEAKLWSTDICLSGSSVFRSISPQNSGKTSRAQSIFKIYVKAKEYDAIGKVFSRKTNLAKVTFPRRRYTYDWIILFFFLFLH